MKRYHPKDCASCGRVFQPNTSTAKYCGSECGERGFRGECAHCGETFFARRPDRLTFCSRRCSGLTARKPLPSKPAPSPRPCLTCGEDFVPAGSARYCGNECRMEMARRKALQYGRAKHKRGPFTCKECGGAFAPTYGNKRRAFCSDTCAKRSSNRGQDGDSRKRAKKHGVPYEYINKRKVYRRDGWVCGLCGGRIDRKVKYPDPLSASLDHIVPMSRGGGHLYRNVQASHLSCNTAKGAGSAGEQMLLVG